MEFLNNFVLYIDRDTLQHIIETETIHFCDNDCQKRLENSSQFSQLQKRVFDVK
jgi:hypothetical protein